MIVVDANILAYLLLSCEQTPLAEKTLQLDREWSAPALWQSEFLNILAGHIRIRGMSTSEALTVFKQAQKTIAHREFSLIPERVLRLITSSPCSAYDCEYVALAEDIRSPLITEDKLILQNFPRIAVSLEKFTKA